MARNDEYEQKRESIRQELMQNDTYNPFWQKYGEKEKERFVDYYAMQKAFYLLYGKKYFEDQEKRDGELLDLATEYLTIIQQKKLFDLQCLWRAEKIKIDVIEISFQFVTYGRNIEHCSFLEPISKDEVSLLKNFVLNHAEVLDRPLRGNWQDYPRDDTSIGFTHIEEEWYEFYELHTGSKGLHLLPDIRGEKEERYMDAVRKHTNQEKKDAQASPSPAPFYRISELETAFMKLYEPSKIHDYKRAYEINSQGHKRMDLLWALEFSDSYDGDAPVQSNSSWEQATVDAATRIWRKKLTEAIDNAYEIRQQKIQLGIPLAGEWDDSFNRIADSYKESIFKGRKLLGEPEDFNF
ncbi:MAG: hypothetical protein ACOC2M_02370 [bacterium]